MSNESEKNIGKIILDIKQKYGNEIIYDSTRLNALLMDYANDMTKERKLLINVLQNGIINRIEKDLEEKNNNSEIIVRKYVSQLTNELWITEKAALYAINIILYILGCDKSEIMDDLIKNDSHKNKEVQFMKGMREFGEIINKVDLEKYQSIGYKAFASSSQIKEIYISDNIKIIYPKAFLNCRSLRKIVVSPNIEVIGRGIFDGCVNIEEIIIENNKNYLAANGFLIEKKGKKLIRSFKLFDKNISILNGIKVICKKAFEKQQLEIVKIPVSVEKIEENSFFYTIKMNRVNVDVNNKFFCSIDGVLYSKDKKKLILYPQGKKDIAYYIETGVEKIEKKAFSNTLFLSSVTFSDGIKEIGNNAFEYCNKIENIILPRSVESIGERAFQYCKNLISVMLPKGITIIGDCAFLGCSFLKTVSVPRSVVEIGNMAFADCKSISRVVIQENVKFIGDKAFYNCNNIEILISGNEYVASYCKAHGIKYDKL